MKPKILCICTMGRNRSKYLAKYLKEKGYETRYGGVGPCKTDPVPENPAKKEDMEWADIIITARKKHKPILIEKYGIKNKRIITLDVKDSQKAASEIYPEFKDIENGEFNKKYTYPKLRKAIEPYLPLKIELPIPYSN